MNMKSWRVQERIIDATGSTLVAACAIAFFWLIANGSELARGEVVHLRQVIEKAAADVRVLKDEQTGLRENMMRRQEALKTSGRLPDTAPVESYFQTLSAKASEHGLRVMRHHPVAQPRCRSKKQC